ncbi:MAG: BMP family ABC transporter substrate-binding protein [Firmicutes bacterium]|nr:BMP family ABC transporter substrate-binding protein [Bacillota bacterium]
MRIKRLAVAALLVLALVAVAACGGTAKNTGTQTASESGSEQGQGGKVIKVGLVTDVGGLDDHGFNELAYKGLQKAAQDLGVQVNVVQSKQQSDYIPNLTNFANQGYDLVIAVGFLMTDAVHQVAPQFPNTKFGIIDVDYNSVVTDSGQDANADKSKYANVAGTIFKTEQCGYLAGVLAGLVEKNNALPGLQGKNTVGVVGGIAIPPVDSYIAGFQQGVKAVNPDAKVLLEYANAFDNPQGGKEIALAEYAQGADIVFQVAGGTGLGVIDAAKEKHLYAIGVDADQNYLGPDNVITSAMKGVDTATYQLIKAVVDGTFKAGDFTFDLANGGVGLGVFAKSVPQDIIDQVNQAAEDIKAGKIQISAQVQK